MYSDSRFPHIDWSPFYSKLTVQSNRVRTFFSWCSHFWGHLIRDNWDCPFFHIDLTHSSYTANPFMVRRYFWRGWRGEFGNFIFTKPPVMAGVREYSRKLGRFFKPISSIISFTLFSSVPIAMINRFIFSDNVDAVSSKLVWVLVWVLVWGSSVSLYPISI